MDALTNGIINVHVDPHDKMEATKILKDLGLNMTTLINMTLKQVIKKKAVPFEITSLSSNSDLEEALRETINIEEEFKDGKRDGYKNANDMLRSIIDD